ncbi:MAG TPA: oligosaccharide flippase family protein [Bacteroidota bacterium]|nr:oligosaccharide flippase family protein [Bacteroidota bacterium]
MFDKLLRLGKETAIYGLSSILGRLINFVLAPFYTNVLLTTENGVVAYIYAYIAFAYVVYCYGFEIAYMRYVSTLEIGDRKQNFSTPFLSLLATSVTLSSLIHIFSGTIAGWLSIPAQDSVLIRYAAWILCFDTLSVVPFASMRMDQQPKTFAALKLFNISLTVALNLVLILAVHMRAEGVFLANLIGSIATFLLTFAVVRSKFVPTFSTKLFRELLKYGLPLIPSGLAGMALQIVDRPIVKALTNEGTLGIYQLNYRLGIAMMLIVGMFDYAWRPFFLTNAREPNARQLFAKVFTYFILALLLMFLAVSFFVDDLVRVEVFGKHFFHPDYWVGTGIVPWILLAYVFNGAYVVFIAGAYLEKKTKHLPLVTGLGAAVNVGVNFLLIPPMGIMGAALATLASYAVMAVTMYFTSQRFYRIDYEWGKIVAIIAATTVAFICYKLIGPAPLDFAGELIKIGLILGFVGSLPLLGVVKKSDLESVRRAVLEKLNRS